MGKKQKKIKSAGKSAEKQARPLLTIGMIFRNDRRSLERCLKALAPLRRAIPCELVMADTGSEDGSREIAARYADILFDLPWPGDFSVARNAVMDRASGKWYLTVDSDEYLDSNVSELVAFIKDDGRDGEHGCLVTQRNYKSLEMDGEYTDFQALRLIRMSLGLRYMGAVHESWTMPEGTPWRIRALTQTILHHDGYAGTDKAAAKAKSERNLKILRNVLGKDPDNLAALLQYIESGTEEADYLDTVFHAAKLVEGKHPDWKYLGPAVFRHAVWAAEKNGLPELEAWAARAMQWFPDSFHSRIDVEYIVFSHSWEKGDYAGCIKQGENFLKAMEDYSAGKGDWFTLLASPLLFASPQRKQALTIFLADAYVRQGNPKRAMDLLGGLDAVVLDGVQAAELARVLCLLHSCSHLDTAPVFLALFEGMQQPIPSAEKKEERIKMFWDVLEQAFRPRSRQAEQKIPGFCRPSYTLLLPLKERFDLGRAAAALGEKDPAALHQILAGVEDWDSFPKDILIHALANGMEFPLPERPLCLEEMDCLAGSLAADWDRFLPFVLGLAKKEGTSQEGFSGTAQGASQEDLPGAIPNRVWLQRLAVAAVNAYPWEEEKDGNGDDGITAARFFAHMEEWFLSNYYSASLLDAKNIRMLPSLHRFGWCLAMAFAALDGADTAGYVKWLKEGVGTYHNAKSMVEYLLCHTPQLQKMAAPAGQQDDLAVQRQQEEAVPKELLSLARQVKAILAAYPAGDPAVEALKASPAYQKVAWLIEGDK